MSTIVFPNLSSSHHPGPTDPIQSVPLTASAQISLQGVSVQLNTNCAGLADYACDHFHDFAIASLDKGLDTGSDKGPNSGLHNGLHSSHSGLHNNRNGTSHNGSHRGSHSPNATGVITLNVVWIEPGDSLDPPPQFQPVNTMKRMGRRVYGSENELLWLAPFTVDNLQYRFRLTGNHLVVDAIYHFSPRPGKTADELALKRTRKFFSLMKHLVLYPVSWYQEYFYSRYLLHASAVRFSDKARGDKATGDNARDDKTIAIAGVGGVGKTTTSLALLGQPQTQMVAENLLFYDHAHLYSCYEPIRADDNSLNMIGARHPGLVPSRLLPILKEKQVYHLPKEFVCQKAKAGPIFIPTFSNSTQALPLDKGDALDRLLAMNMQTREVNAYYWFAATLALQWPKASRELTRINHLKDLLEQSPIYELHVDPQLGVHPVVETILKFV